jgi:hypothetical protein
MQKQHIPMSKAPHIKTTVTFLTNEKIGNGKQCVGKQVGDVPSIGTGVDSIAAAPTEAPVSAALPKKLAVPILSRKRRAAQPRKPILASFKFQPFKKCFNPKCKVLFVPGDFKPSSPRRMFCSSDCFAEHWREQLAVVFSSGPNLPSSSDLKPHHYL